MEQAGLLCGTISSNPARNARGTGYTARLELSSVGGMVDGTCMQSAATGSVQILLPARLVESRFPGRVTARGSAPAPELFFETGARLRCTGRWEAGSAVFLVTSAEADGFPRGVSGSLARFRAVCRLAFRRLLYSWGDAGGLVLSLLAGAREYTEPELADAFRQAGLSHILALSGMHLSFFSGLAGGLWSRLFGRRHAFVAQLAGIAGFVWFAGSTPSLVRAGISALILMLCSLVSCRKPNNLGVLAATFILHLLFRPEDLGTAAAQLSYGALLGILLFSSSLERLAVRVLPPALSRSLAASAGAQAATCPVTLYLFGAVMPVGIIASVVVSPLVSAFMTLALAGVACCLAMPFLSPLFGCILKLLYNVIACAVPLFARVPPFVVQQRNDAI